MQGRTETFFQRKHGRVRLERMPRGLEILFEHALAGLRGCISAVLDHLELHDDVSTEVARESLGKLCFLRWRAHLPMPRRKREPHDCAFAIEPCAMGGKLARRTLQVELRDQRRPILGAGRGNGRR